MIDEADQARLVAFIDDQLDEASRRTMETRLAAEPALRALHERLAAGSLPFARAFETVLAEAPVARLQGKIDALKSNASPPRLRRFVSGAAAALLLLCVGWAAGRYAPTPGGAPPVAMSDRDDWREAVADYVSLYTSETFPGSGAANESAALGRLSQTLGVKLTPDAVELPDLSFKWANMLAYDGAPLGQIAYLAGGNPVVFCIIRNGQRDAPVKTETREGIAIAAWARGGRGFLVAGRIPEKQATELAGTLASRF